jgi:hypothetical protein
MKFPFVEQASAVHWRFADGGAQGLCKPVLLCPPGVDVFVPGTRHTEAIRELHSFIQRKRLRKDFE